MSDKNNKPMFNVKGLQKRLGEVEGRYQEGGSFANYEVFKPKPGINRLRLIPLTDKDLPFVPVGWHYKILGQNVLCRRHCSYEENASCPICTLVTDLLRTGEEKNVEIGKRIRSSPLSSWVVIDRSLKEEGLPKLKVWHASKRVSQQLIDYLKEPETWGNFLDFYEGKDIQLKMAEVKPHETGGYRSYTLSIIPKSSPVVKSEKELKELLENMPEILFSPQTEEKLEEMVKKFYESGLEKGAKEFESSDEMDEEELPFKHSEEQEVEDDEEELAGSFGVSPPEKEEEKETSGDGVDDDISKILDGG